MKHDSLLYRLETSEFKSYGVGFLYESLENEEFNIEISNISFVHLEDLSNKVEINFFDNENNKRKIDEFPNRFYKIEDFDYKNYLLKFDESSNNGIYNKIQE